MSAAHFSGCVLSRVLSVLRASTLALVRGRKGRRPPLISFDGNQRRAWTFPDGFPKQRLARNGKCGDKVTRTAAFVRSVTSSHIGIFARLPRYTIGSTDILSHGLQPRFSLHL